MKQERKALILKICIGILIVLTILFIFSNSLTVGSVSQATSDGILGKLSKVSSFFGMSYETASFIIRKMGHLLEFTLLGALLSLQTRLYSKKLSHISWPLLIGLIVAVCDEFLQLFTLGRSSQVSDVMIDFVGIILGLLFIYLVSLLISFIKKRKTI